jgi:glycosyltransferase involved in cell wall biosynthesis
LKSLQKQSLDYNDWEILLIDNASQQKVSETFDITWHPHARHLDEKKVGKTNAWTLGIAQANSDLIICVDDDNLLDPNYLEEAVKISTEFPFVGAWGGNIVPEYEIPPPGWIGDQVWRLTVKEVREDRWSNLREGFETMPAGAGMCVSKSVAEHYLLRCRLQKTALMLDRSGSGLSGYGDMDLAQCAIDIGMGTGLFSRLNLTHLIPAGRLTLDYFIRHSEGDAASFMLYRALRGLPIYKQKKSRLASRILYLFLRATNKITKERHLINKAYIAGTEKGYKAIKSMGFKIVENEK